MKSLAKNIVMWSSQILAGLLLLEFACILGCQRTTSKVEASTDAVGQATFATPQEAGQALQAAARANDESALAHVLGANSRAILSSGDVTEDKAAIAEFVAKYDRMNRWVTMTDGSQVLYIGADNYPYPISLARNAASQWYFNTGAGKDEILARRIGKNELLAIDAVSAMGNAEQLYFKSAHDGNQPHHYTQKILSTPGKQDGLYWEVPPDQPSSPLGRLNDFARDVVSSTQPGAPPIFDGYSFRSLPHRETKPATARGATSSVER